MENIIKNRKHKHLTEIERGQISMLKAQGYTVYKIAKIMQRAYNTIAYELEKGTTTVIVNGWKEKTAYFPERGQSMYLQNRQKSCTKTKIMQEKYKPFIEFVEQTFFQKKWSMEVIYNYALKKELFSKENMVCKTTLYTYIDKGYLKIKNIDLPNKITRKPKKKNTTQKNRYAKYGRNIEERPKLINNREEFGHWEIDTIIGKKNKNENSLLVITERKSRMEIIRKLQAKTSENVMKEIDCIKKKLGNNFSNIFKTITSDNGLEFSKLYELEKRTNTQVYYAHPYSSFERGSNERNNRIIRYFVPKNKTLNKLSKNKINNIQNWLNNLPRKIFDFETAEDIFFREIEKLSIKKEAVRNIFPTAP